MNINKILTGIVLVLFLLNQATLLAVDWPQWRGPNRDGKATGFQAPAKWPAELKQQWSVVVGAGDASPVLVAGKLYVYARQNDEEILICLDAKNGMEHWRNANPAPEIKGPPSSHPGPRSTPTVANGKVITLGAGGILTCTDAISGKVIWRKEEFTSVPDFYTAMSPIVVDDVCIAHLGGKDDGLVIAFNLQTGAEKWQWKGDGPTYSSPVLATISGTRQIVLYSDKNLMAFKPGDGTLLWSIPAQPERRFYNVGTPLIDGNRIFITGQGLGTRVVEIGSAPDYSAKELWSNAEYGISFNTPVLKDGYIYGIEAAKGKLYCLDAATGQTAWADTTRLDRFGSVIDAGSVMVASSAKADLVVFAPSTDEFKKLAHYKVSEKSVYAHPILTDKNIFIKDEERLSLFTLQ